MAKKRVWAKIWDYVVDFFEEDSDDSEEISTTTLIVVFVIGLLITGGMWWWSGQPIIKSNKITVDSYEYGTEINYYYKNGEVKSKLVKSIKKDFEQSLMINISSVDKNFVYNFIRKKGLDLRGWEEIRVWVKTSGGGGVLSMFFYDVDGDIIVFSNSNILDEQDSSIVSFKIKDFKLLTNNGDGHFNKKDVLGYGFAVTGLEEFNPQKIYLDKLEFRR